MTKGAACQPLHGSSSHLCVSEHSMPRIATRLECEHSQRSATDRCSVPRSTSPSPRERERGLQPRGNVLTMDKDGESSMTRSPQRFSSLDAGHGPFLSPTTINLRAVSALQTCSARPTTAALTIRIPVCDSGASCIDLNPELLLRPRFCMLVGAVLEHRSHASQPPKRLDLTVSR